jgi:hypothetical protein
MAGGYIYILGSHTGTLYIAVTINCVPPEDPVLGLRRLKSLDQHRQDKRPRGSFDSAPSSPVSRDRSVTRSAQDDDFVGVLTKERPKQVSAYGMKSWVLS